MLEYGAGLGIYGYFETLACLVIPGRCWSRTIATTSQQQLSRYELMPIHSARAYAVPCMKRCDMDLRARVGTFHVLSGCEHPGRGKSDRVPDRIIFKEAARRKSLNCYWSMARKEKR